MHKSELKHIVQSDKNIVEALESDINVKNTAESWP